MKDRYLETEVGVINPFLFQGPEGGAGKGDKRQGGRGQAAQEPDHRQC